MPDQNTPPISFMQIVKHPVSYALVVVVGLLGYAARGYTGATSESINNCKEENIYLRNELRQANSDKDQLYTALLIKNGIILQQEQEKKNLDSTIRNTLGPKVKKLSK